MLRSALNHFGQRFKGPDYRLDPALPISSLLALAARRSVWLLRGFMSFPLRGVRVFVGANVTLRNKGMLHVSHGVTLGQGCMIDAISTKGIKLGRNVNIGPYTIIQASGVLTRLGTGCEIGDNSGIGGFSSIGCGGGVKIGNDVIMGQYISFHSENHITDRTDIPIRKQGVSRKGVVVEDDCWVGAKVTFLDGSHVGRGCIIAAGTVVRGIIPPYSVIAGVPCRVIRSRLTESHGHDV